MSFYTKNPLLMDKEADAVENAVNAALEAGYRIGDIMSEGMTLVSCSETGTKIAEYIKAGL